MAITEKYVTDSGAGSADGSSLSNAWSWATMLTSLTSGQRANVFGAISRGTNSDAFTNPGATAPIMIRGIHSVAGDLDFIHRTPGLALVTTNWAVVTYTTGRLTLPAHMIWEPGITITSAVANNTVTAVITDHIRGMNAINTQATSSAASCLGGSGVVEDCDFNTLSTSASSTGMSWTSGPVKRCRSVSTNGQAFSGGGITTFIQCCGYDSLTGVHAGGTDVVVDGCSFRNLSGQMIDNSGQITYVNCVGWMAGGSSKEYNSSGSIRNFSSFNNFVGNTGAGDTNAGDWPKVNLTTLTADPFTSSSNFTLNNTAGGGAACQGVGNTPYLDGGAYQVQNTGGGGGGSAGGSYTFGS